jgi:hypothetical protein
MCVVSADGHAKIIQKPEGDRVPAFDTQSGVKAINVLEGGSSSLTESMAKGEQKAQTRDVWLSIGGCTTAKADITTA